MPQTLIDTHSHIYLSEFKEDLENLIKRAENEGVKKIAMPAVDSETHQALLAVAGQFPGICFPMMGLHPCSVKENYKEELRIARELLEQNHCVAVGETGLDFYWDKTYTAQQFDAFHEQMEWALEFRLPVVIHSRNSIDECIRSVRDHQDGNLRGVFHCFSGNAEQAKQITGLGFYLGIGGVLTYKNSGLDKAIADVEAKWLVLETDAPYLTPVPFRGKRNEPAYLRYVLEKLADLREMTPEAMAMITSENACRLFHC